MTRFYYHGWTHDEDRRLSEIMLSGHTNRKKVGELFTESSEELQRTYKSCQNRWYEIRHKYVGESKAV